MSSKRIDRLLAETLDGGRIPHDATLEERNEVLRLVAAAQAIQSTRTAATLEADQTYVTSQARFARHIARSRTSPSAARRPRFSGRFAALAAFGSLATAAAVVLAVLLALGPLTSDVDTATAVEVGDFVQLEGTIPEGGVSADGRTLDVETSLGRFSVDILHDTAVVDGTDVLEPGSLRPGDTLVVAGLVGERNRVQAASLSRTDGTPALPGLRIGELQDFRPGIEGVVVAVALPQDGLQARVVIENTARDRFLLLVSAATVAELVEAGAGGLGAVVRVVDDPGAGPGVLGLDVSATSERPLRGVNIAGVVLSAEGPVLELSTLRGARTVVLRASTRIVLPEGSLSPAERDRPGALVGHRVAVQGQSAADGRFYADVLIVGAEHRPGDRVDGPLRGP